MDFMIPTAALIMIVVVNYVGFLIGTDVMKDQAVAKGHAEYILDGKIVKFLWKVK